MALQKMHPRCEAGGEGWGSKRPAWKRAAAGSGRLLVLLVVVDLGKFRVDDVLFLATSVAAGGRAAGSAAGRAFLRLLVHGLAELHRRLRQRVGLGRDRSRIAALEGFLEVGHGVLNRAPIVLADLRAVLGERLLGAVHQRLGVVLGFHLGLALLVVLGVRLRVLDHALDVGLRQPARGLDADLLLLAGALVLGLHVDNAIGVDVERD